MKQGLILPDRIHGLDGLRALACLAVFGVHFQQFVKLQAHVGPFDLSRFLENGNTGVALFFVLSGFLLSIPFWRNLDRGERAPNWAGFWLKRASRILPAYYLCLTLLVINNHLWEQAGEGNNILLHYLLLFNYSSQSIFAINPAFWTLAVEMQFYALFPFIFLLLTGLPRGFRVAGLLMLAILAYFIHLQIMQCGHCQAWGSLEANTSKGPNPVLAYSLLAHLPHFLLGVMGGSGYWMLSAIRKRHYLVVQGWAEGVAWIAIFLVLIILATPLEDKLSIPFGHYTLPLVPMALALIVVCTHYTVLLKSLLELPPIRWIGQVSYGVYIFHLPVLNVIERYMRNAGWPVAQHWLIFLIIAIALTLAVAAISYYLLERPLLRIISTIRARPR